jgi:hypothetical protein
VESEEKESKEKKNRFEMLTNSLKLTSLLFFFIVGLTCLIFHF